MIPFLNKKTYGLSSIQHVQLMFEAKEAIRKHSSHAVIWIIVVLFGFIVFSFFHLVTGTLIGVFGLIFFVWHLSKVATFKIWLQRLIFENLKEIKGSEMFLVPFSKVNQGAAKDFLSALEDNERKASEAISDYENKMNLLIEAFERGEHKTPKAWSDFLKNKGQRNNKEELELDTGIEFAASKETNNQVSKEKTGVNNEKEYLRNRVESSQEIRFFSDFDDAGKHGIEFKNPLGKFGDLTLYKNIMYKEQVFEYNGIIPKGANSNLALNSSNVKDLKIIGNIIYKKAN